MAFFFRALWHAFLVRPLMHGYLRLEVRHADRLPRAGPAVIVANHNSHLDALALMSLLPMREVGRVRPVAAADYFCTRRWLEWFVTRVMGAIPVHRHPILGPNEDPLGPCTCALMRGHILIYFPEGSRGRPGEIGEFKRGLAHLLRPLPHVPVIPVYLDGLSGSLPKGHHVPKPRRCTAVVGHPLRCTWDADALLASVRDSLVSLRGQTARRAANA